MRNMVVGAIDILVFLETYQCHKARSSDSKYTLQHSERGEASSGFWGEQVPFSLHPNALGRHSIMLRTAASDQRHHLYSQL